MPPRATEENIDASICNEKGSNFNGNIEELLRYTAKKYNLAEEELIFIANCESSFNPQVIHKNDNGSIDRGLFQINNRYHPEVSDECAFDPVCAAEFTAQSIKDGHIGWWVCSHSRNSY